MPGERAPTIRVWLDGEAIDQASERIIELEIEERADEASRFSLSVDMSPIDGDGGDGDWDQLEHGTFARDNQLPDLRLLKRVTIEFGLREDEPDAEDVRSVVFDGYATSVEAVFGENRVPDSKLVLSGIDASCLMHLQTVTKEWHTRNDAAIARELLGKYGFSFDGESIEETAPTRELSRSTLVQRGTDAELLRSLAQRNGFEFYVEPDEHVIPEQPSARSVVKGHFHRPRPDVSPQPALTLFPPEAPSLIEYRARWESHQPTRMLGFDIDERSRRVRRTNIDDTGYPSMGEVNRAAVLKDRLKAILPDGSEFEASDIQSTLVPHDDRELENLARSALRTADWFVVGTGTVRCERYPTIVRSRRPIELKGAGHLLDGRWYVQAVRHRWNVPPYESEEEPVTARYEADVTLLRNALGAQG